MLYLMTLPAVQCDSVDRQSYGCGSSGQHLSRVPVLSHVAARRHQSPVMLTRVSHQHLHPAFYTLRQFIFCFLFSAGSDPRCSRIQSSLWE